MEPVDIVNLGLGFIGCGPIASFDEETKLAARVKGSFDGLRDKVLEDRDWTFAIGRLAAQRDAAAPAWGYPSRYELPADVLRAIEVVDSSGAGSIDAFAAGLYPVGGGLDWQKEGRFIVADTRADQLYVRAVMRVTDARVWSPSFCQCLAARVARDLCLPLADNHALFRDMASLYRDELLEAAANDGRQGRTQRVGANRLASARRG